MVWLAPESADMAGPSIVAEGIFATTRIATSQGWQIAGNLRPGMRVLTFDGGEQTLVRRTELALGEGPASLWPLLVPPWVLDNREEIILLPEQKVLIEADVAEELYGDPFALIPAQALIGWRGIARCRPAPLSGVVQLGFATSQVVYASRGVLLSCPGETLAEVDWLEPDYAAYSLAQARHLMTCLMAEEAGAALRAARQHLPGFQA